MPIVPIKSTFLNMVKRRRLGTEPKKALSIDRDFDPAENVKLYKFCAGPAYQHINLL